MNEPLKRALELALGTAVAALRPVAGGDINRAYAATLASGATVFVKTRDDALHETGPLRAMYLREADGLGWLRAAGAVRIPEVLAATDQLLALEWIEPGRRQAGFDEALGRGLAVLHRAGAPSFGLDQDNFIGTLPQANAPVARWSDFYRTRRLEPLVARARAGGLLDRRALASFERLYARLEALVGPEEPPARLHGDLWSGNVHADARGLPALIDPAAYGGQREVDLAMLQLFGAPSARLFAAYDEVYPRAPDHAERVALYQLYPLLVHVNLFGAGYVAQLLGALARYAA